MAKPDLFVQRSGFAGALLLGLCVCVWMGV